MNEFESENRGNTTSLKEIVDALVRIDKNLGFQKFVKYLLFVVILWLAVTNVKSIVTWGIEFIQNINEEIHTEKMELRDEYMKDLNVLLIELRAELNADRILYFEFHNSEENLDGLPFKFFDLMTANSKYGVRSVTPLSYKDINASMYSELFTCIDDGDIVVCHSSEDSAFLRKYRGIYDLVNSTDGSTGMAIFAVPGVLKPIGFIIVEWIDNDDEEGATIHDVDTNKIHNFLPRINALGVSIRGRLLK